MPREGHKPAGTGNWKKHRDKHQKADYTSDKKRKKDDWDGTSGRPKKRQ